MSGAVVEVCWTDEEGLPDHVLVAWVGKTPGSSLHRADLVICPAVPHAWRRAGDALATVPGAVAAIAGDLIRFRGHDRVPGPAGPGIEGWPRYPGGGQDELSVSAAIAVIRASTRCAFGSRDP